MGKTATMVVPGVASFQDIGSQALLPESGMKGLALVNGNFVAIAADGTQSAIGGAAGGNDTIVNINNSAGAPVPALEMVTSLTTNTAGSEASKLLFKLLNAGAVVTALDLRGDRATFLPGLPRAPTIRFSGLNQEFGIYADIATGTIRLGFGNGVNSADFCFGAGGSMFTNAAGGVLGLGGTSSLGVVRDFNSFGIQICPGTLDGVTLKDVLLCYTGAEVPNNATQGFVDFPKMSPASGAGVKPTGVPLTNGALHVAPMIWDDVNFKIHAWSNAAGAWKSSPAFT